MTSAHSHEGESGSSLLAQTMAMELSKNNSVLYLRLGKNFKIKEITPNLTFVYIPSKNYRGLVIPQIDLIVKNKIFSAIDSFKPEIVHLQNMIFGSVVATIWAKKNNVPVVLTLHHIPTQGATFVFTGNKNINLVKFLDKLNLHAYSAPYIKSVDLVIALNNSIVDSLRQIDPAIKYKVINNGININSLLNLKRKKPVKYFRFVYPGSFNERKNQIFLAQTFNLLPDNFKLFLYGNKESGFTYLTKLKKIISENNSRNIKILEYKNHKEMLRAYENSDFLVSASKKEVQSLVIIEALAAGLPVIGLENETTQELINTKIGLVMPLTTTPPDFAMNLIAYAETAKKDYYSISKNCRTNIGNFKTEIVAAKLLKEYVKLTGNYNSNTKRSGVVFLYFLYYFSVLTAKAVEIYTLIKNLRFSGK